MDKMISVYIKNLKKYLLFCMFLHSTIAATQLNAATCDPGSHWLDSCNGAVDTNLQMNGVLGLNFIGLGDFIIPMEGIASISRSNPLDTMDPLDPGHLNQINMEIISSVLTNIDPIPGAGNVTLRIGINSGVATASTGEMIETNDEFLVDSFFDIFFEVDSALGVFHNNEALRIVATTDSWLPDGGIFYAIDAASNGLGVFNSTDQLIATIDDLDGTGGLTISPAAVPLPPAMMLFCSGLLGLFFSRRYINV